jgi:outer membrane receptor protein involved in Fe transport
MLKILRPGSLFCAGVLLVLSNVYAQERHIISGRVIDAGDIGLYGATIQLKGKNVATSSEANGKFSLNVASNDTLIVSIEDYTTKEVQVAASMSTVNISLEPDDNLRRAHAVTALGIQKDRKLLPYATQQISGDELRGAAQINFADALSGKIAGLDIRVSNSGAGGSTKALLRGERFIQVSNEPLYVIDGIPMVNNKGEQPVTYGGTDSGDGLSMINPSDIERIDVLKGLQSADVFGMPPTRTYGLNLKLSF